MMFSPKNILNGLGRAVYGGKPHNVPKALQSVNMKNTSEEGREGGREERGASERPVGACTRSDADVANMSHFAISVPI